MSQQQLQPTPEQQLQVSQLCGRWEGKSTSRNNDPTYWKESVLEFKLITATYGSIIGHGVSLWRNMHIEFDVRGTFDWDTKEIKLIKQHKGVYTNTVQYAALINPEQGTIMGEYSNGVIDLARGHASSDDPKEILSGMWLGESVSRSNDPTTWTDTVVEFKLGPDGRHGTITGHGISLWRDMKISFTVSGEFDWETLEVTLTKQHIGRYTNSVMYSGVILPDRCAIEGHYQNGSISLRKVDGLLSTENGQQRNPEEQAEWEKKRAEYNKEREETEKVARQRAAETRQIEVDLGGVWSGISTDVDENITKWSETAMKFKLDPFEWIGKITGSGVSEWRDKRIDFDIEGRFDWNTKKVDLVKQHKGAYTNRVRYTCRIIESTTEGKMATVPPLPGEEGEEGEEGKSGGDSGGDSGGGKTWLMEGFYAKGKIELSKTRGFSGGVHPSMLGTSTYGHKTSSGESGGGGGAGEGKTNSEEGPGGGNSTNSKQPSHHSLSVLEKYETYLAGVIGDGKGLSSQDQMLLANFRSHLGLTEADHMTALRNMKMTLAEFTTMCQSGEEKTDDICKICFVNPINSVILPCGHFSICVDCGQRLQAKDARAKCPICRVTMTKIQQIFRS
jgi:hypothetical protein